MRYSQIYVKYTHTILNSYTCIWETCLKILTHWGMWRRYGDKSDYSIFLIMHLVALPKNKACLTYFCVCFLSEKLHCLFCNQISKQLYYFILAYKYFSFHMLLVAFLSFCYIPKTILGSAYPTKASSKLCQIQYFY